MSKTGWNFAVLSPWLTGHESNSTCTRQYGPHNHRIFYTTCYAVFSEQWTVKLVDFGNWNYVLYSSTELQWGTENDMCICLINGINLINGTADMAHITIEFSTQLVVLCFWICYLWADGSYASFPNCFIQYPQSLSSWPLWALLRASGGHSHWLECLSHTTQLH